MNNKESQEIYSFVIELMAERDRAIVGKLLENIEILEKEKNFNPKVYKQLAKTIVWGENRNFKKLLRAHFMPSITFTK